MPIPSALSQIDLIGYIVVGIILLIPGLTALIAVVTRLNYVAAMAIAGKEGADLARERTHDLANHLATFRIEVTRDYASKSMISEMRAEVLGAIEKLGARFDRMLENRHTP